jgi:archaeal flagellin FlaB
MYHKFMKAFGKLGRRQKGITGLETAIILIAFVTVASVLGYSVLSAGIFSAEKGKAAVYQGLSQAQASMQVKGSVFATTDATPLVTNVSFTLASVLNDESVDMTEPLVAGEDATNENTLVINYTDSTGLSANNLLWTATYNGKAGASAGMLGPNEQMLIDVELPVNTMSVYDSFTLQIVPAKGAAITLERSLTSLIASGTIDLN